MVTPNLSDFIIKYETLETVRNFSDHVPIIMKMNIDIEYLQTVKKTISPSVSWTKCTNEHISRYQGEIDKKLEEIELDFEIFTCRDTKCELHSEQIRSWYNEIVRILLDSSAASLPMTGNKQNPKTVPGWNEFVKPKLETSLFWHNIWKDCDRPRHVGSFYILMIANV